MDPCGLDKTLGVWTHEGSYFRLGIFFLINGEGGGENGVQQGTSASRMVSEDFCARILERWVFMGGKRMGGIVNYFKFVLFSSVYPSIKRSEKERNSKITHPVKSHIFRASLNYQQIINIVKSPRFEGGISPCHC